MFNNSLEVLKKLGMDVTKIEAITNRYIKSLSKEQLVMIHNQLKLIMKSFEESSMMENAELLQSSFDEIKATYSQEQFEMEKEVTDMSMNMTKDIPFETLSKVFDDETEESMNRKVLEDVVAYNDDIEMLLKAA